MAPLTTRAGPGPPSLLVTYLPPAAGLIGNRHGRIRCFLSTHQRHDLGRYEIGSGLRPGSQRPVSRGRAGPHRNRPSRICVRPGQDSRKNFVCRPFTPPQLEFRIGVCSHRLPSLLRLAAATTPMRQATLRSVNLLAPAIERMMKAPIVRHRWPPHAHPRPPVHPVKTVGPWFGGIPPSSLGRQSVAIATWEGFLPLVQARRLAIPYAREIMKRRHRPARPPCAVPLRSVLPNRRGIAGSSWRPMARPGCESDHSPVPLQEILAD